MPEATPAQEGNKIVLQKSCEGEEFLFCYGYDERIYHAKTNLCLVQVGIYEHHINLSTNYQLQKDTCNAIQESVVLNAKSWNPIGYQS